MSIDILNSNDKLIHVLFIVKTASGQSHSVTACGNVELPTVSGKRHMIDDVLLMPGIRRNLLSIGTLTDAGMIAWFDCNQCWPLADKTQLRIIARGQRDDSSGIYYLNFKALHHLSTSTAARGVPNLPLIKSSCEQCHMGKQFQTQHRRRASQDLLHHWNCCIMTFADQSPDLPSAKLHTSWTSRMTSVERHGFSSWRTRTKRSQNSRDLSPWSSSKHDLKWNDSVRTEEWTILQTTSTLFAKIKSSYGNSPWLIHRNKMGSQKGRTGPFSIEPEAWCTTLIFQQDHGPRSWALQILSSTHHQQHQTMESLPNRDSL